MGIEESQPVEEFEKREFETWNKILGQRGVGGEREGTISESKHTGKNWF